MKIKGIDKFQEKVPILAGKKIFLLPFYVFSIFIYTLYKRKNLLRGLDHRIKNIRKKYLLFFVKPNKLGVLLNFLIKRKAKE